MKIWKTGRSARTGPHSLTVKRKELRVAPYEDFTQTCQATVRNFSVASLLEAPKQSVRAGSGESNNHRDAQKSLICKIMLSLFLINRVLSAKSLCLKEQRILRPSLYHRIPVYMELLSEARYWMKDRRKKWQEDEEEEVSSYWMTLRKQEDTGNWKRKH